MGVRAPGHAARLGHSLLPDFKERDFLTASLGTRGPAGYSVQLLGESAEREAAQGRLGLYGLAAAIAIFILLQVAFGSFRLAALFFFTLPLALVGGALGAYARRRHHLARLARRVLDGV